MWNFLSAINSPHFLFSFFKMILQILYFIAQLVVIYHINMYFSSNSLIILASFCIYIIGGILSAYETLLTKNSSEDSNFEFYTSFITLTIWYLIMEKILIRKYIIFCKSFDFLVFFIFKSRK